MAQYYISLPDLYHINMSGYVEYPVSWLYVCGYIGCPGYVVILGVLGYVVILGILVRNDKGSHIRYISLLLYIFSCYI